MKNKSYWCPRCGRMFTYETSFGKHVDSKKCKTSEERDNKKKEK